MCHSAGLYNAPCTMRSCMLLVAVAYNVCIMRKAKSDVDMQNAHAKWGWGLRWCFGI